MRSKLTERAILETEIPEGQSRVRLWDSQVVGFGAVVGRSQTSFVAQARVDGKQRVVKIGIAGRQREDGHTWNVARARKKARELLASMAVGVNPNAKIVEETGPTLRKGLELHVRNMQRKGRSQKSIDCIDGEIRRLMPEWLDRPIEELTGLELEKVWVRIKSNARPKANSVNEPGIAMANRTITQVSAVWNALDKLLDLPGKNPASRITLAKLKPQDSRIPSDGFESWYETVKTLSPVRRDLQLLTLFTAVRSEGIRSFRWGDIDWKSRLALVRVVKGDRPYTIPISSPGLEILRRRENDNTVEFKSFGGDHGWVFPSYTRTKPYTVIKVATPREYRYCTIAKRKVAILPGLHPLRRTHNSVAMEIGVLQEHREALLNHNGRGVNVQVYGRPQNWDHLASCQEKIADALLERLKTKRV